jgi:hypothetical protein
MPERPGVFEGTRIGIQTGVDTPAVPNRILQSLSLTGMPDPKEPGVPVNPAGRRAASGVVRQKRHTEAQLSGQRAYLDQVYAALLTWGNPSAIVNRGNGVYDWYWRPFIDSDPAPLAATFEAGSTDFPSRFGDGQALNASMHWGKGENTWTSDVAGRSLDEATQSFAGTPTVVNIVPIAPKDNSHCVGTAVATLFTNTVCDTEDVTITIGAKRAPHTSQCAAQPSFQSIVPLDETGGNLISLQLQHKSTSRGYLANLRNNDLLYYGAQNIGPAITGGGGLFYEEEFICPFNFLESGGTGEVDNVTGRTWNLKPVYRSDFNPGTIGTPGGWYQYRIRCDIASVPTAANL